MGKTLKFQLPMPIPDREESEHHMQSTGSSVNELYHLMDYLNQVLPKMESPITWDFLIVGGMVRVEFKEGSAILTINWESGIVEGPYELVEIGVPKGASFMEVKTR